MKILMIEDSVADSRLTTLSLRSLDIFNADITHATTVDDGLAAARSGHFDLLIVDQYLIGGLGTDLLRTLRDDGCETPAILVSSANDPNLADTAIKAGAGAFVSKASASPFDWGKMLIHTAQTLLH